MLNNICTSCYYAGIERCDATHDFDVYGKEIKDKHITECPAYTNTRRHEDTLLISRLGHKLKQLSVDDRFVLYNKLEELC
jgi:hypothetical protein